MPHPTAIVRCALVAAVGSMAGTLPGCGGGSGSDGGAPDGSQIVPTWQAVQPPNAAAEDFVGVAYGNGTWVASGTGLAGVFALSSDGTSWSMTPAVANGLIAFGNGVFVTTGEDVAVSTSSNGSDWSTQMLDGGQGLGAAVYGNGTWVLLDNHFLTEDVVAVWTSPDGERWTSVPTTVPYAQPTAVAYGDGQFVLVGYGSLVATSPDGSDWTQQPFPYTDGLLGIAFGNGRFVAVSTGGSAYESTDAIHWTQSTFTQGEPQGICFGNGEFVALPPLLASSDGVTWSQQRFSDPAHGDFAACADGPGYFVAVGESPDFAVSPGAMTPASDGGGTTPDAGAPGIDAGGLDAGPVDAGPACGGSASGTCPSGQMCCGPCDGAYSCHPSFDGHVAAVCPICGG